MGCNLFWPSPAKCSIVDSTMNFMTRQSLTLVVLAMIALSTLGCRSVACSKHATSHTITMRSPECFVVTGRIVDSKTLVKELGRQHIPKDCPLVIEIPINTHFEIVKALTARLASAGYKPYFRNPRHSASTTARNE